MFKTIESCRLDLVAHTVKYAEPLYVDLDDLEGDFYPAIRLECDDMPASAARASFGKQDKTGENPEADKKLMKFLADNKHMTPFEYQHATFLIECPLFVRSQIHRHRTFSYNEISRRYTSENLEFWTPTTWRHQSKSNKQASDGDMLESEQEFLSDIGKDAARHALNAYNVLLSNGVAREQARAVLPQSLLTRFYMGGNLRNWAHFIQLRSDTHAQREVQVIANRIAEDLRKLWPESCKALGIGSEAGSDEEARPAT